MTTYNINVQTWIKQQTKETQKTWPILLYDNITFGLVGDDTKSFVADSCRAAIMHLLNEKEVTIGDAFSISYRTIVTTLEGTIISDTNVKTIFDLPYDAVIRFKEFALQELKLTNETIEQERKNLPSTTKKRSFIKTILKQLSKKI